MNNQDWRERLRERLIELGVSQIEFSEILGVSPQRLSGWLNSSKDPSIEYLESIIQELGVTADWFLFGVKNQKNGVISKRDANLVHKISKLSLQDRKKIEGAIAVLSISQHGKEH